MHRRRWIPILALLVPAIAACSGAGYGGGAYGGGAVTSPPPTVAPAASVAVAPTASGTTSGGTRGDYGTSTSASPSAATAVSGGVHLTGYKFDPATITVAAGSSLTFTNDDSIGHTVVEGENGTPAAGQTPQPVAPGSTVSLAFGTAGAVKLTCTIHPSMSMTVTVTP